MPPHPAEAPPWASGVCAGLHAGGARHVVSVPDNPTSHVVRVLRERYPGVPITTATREEEACGIAAGLYLGGTRPAVMMQSSGLGNSLNAIASLLIPYRIPALLLVSMRGEEDEWNPAQMPMGHAVRPILDALGVAHVTVDRPDAAAQAVEAAARHAFDARLPVACLLSRQLTAPGAAR